MTTKIHALVDGNGIVRRFLLSPGQRHDAPFALELLQGIDLQKVFVLGDRGYDSQNIVSHIEENGGTVVIPSQKNRLMQRAYDVELYKLRNVIERFFSRLKQFRKVAVRFDKLAASFAGFVYLAAIKIFLRTF